MVIGNCNYFFIIKKCFVFHYGKLPFETFGAERPAHSDVVTACANVH